MADPADVEDEEAEEQAPKKNWRRDLEDRAKAAESERDTLKRELAFHRAGLTDLSDKQVKALAATHEGEMTPEALRATAEELGFTKSAADNAAASIPAEQPVEDHSAEAGRIARLAGSPASVSAPSDAKAAFLDKIENWKGPRGREYDEYILANAHLME